MKGIGFATLCCAAMSIFPTLNTDSVESNNLKFSNLLNNFGIYSVYLGPICLNSAVYSINIPIDIGHIEEALGTLNLHCKQFQDVWKPKIANIAESTFPTLTHSEGEYKYKIMNNKTSVDVWNGKVWKEAVITDLVHKVSNELFPTIVSKEDWFTLCQQAEFQEVGKWSTLYIGDHSKYQSVADKDADTQLHFTWILKALNAHKEATDFRKMSLETIDSYNTAILTKLTTTINELRILQALYKDENSKKRGLIDGIGEAAKFLFGVATSTDTQNLANTIHSLSKGSKNALHIAEKLQTVVKLQALSVAKLETKHNDLANITRRIATELIVSLDKERMRELTLTRSLTLRALKTNRDELTHALEEIRSLITELIYELGQVSTGKLSPNLLPPAELKAILDSRKDQKAGPIINIMDVTDEITLRELYSISHTELHVSNQHTFIRINIPLIQPDKIASQHKIFSTELPMSSESKKRFQIIIPDGTVIRTQDDRIMILSRDESEKCKHTKHMVYCNILFQRYVTREEENCLSELTKINGIIDIKDCTTDVLEKPQTINLISVHDDIYIYSAPQRAKLNLKCSKGDPNSSKQSQDDKVLHLARTGLVSIPPTCEINADNFKIERRTEFNYKHSLSKFNIPTILNSTNMNVFLNPLWEAFRKNLASQGEIDKFRLNSIKRELEKNIESGTLNNEEEVSLESELKEIDDMIKTKEIEEESRRKPHPMKWISVSAALSTAMLVLVACIYGKAIMIHIRSKLRILAEFNKEAERRKEEQEAKGELAKLTRQKE